jgi:hypothetical protein
LPALWLAWLDERLRASPIRAGAFSPEGDGDARQSIVRSIAGRKIDGRSQLEVLEINDEPGFF